MRRPLAIAIALLLFAPSVAAAAPTRFAMHAPVVHHLARTLADVAARTSLRFRGVPYAWAGSTPAGFDCSGFVRFVYGRLGIELPHSSYEQLTSGRRIGRRDMLPGDLVFFGGGHVGIYLGHHRFIHAPQTGEVVSVARLDRGWYAARFSAAVRVRRSQRVR